MGRELTDKQKRFADEYLIDMNATQAYLRAGYKVKEEVARANASRLLTNANVSAYIKERQEELSKKTELTQEWVLEHLKTCVSKSMQEEEVMKFDYQLKELVGTGEYIYDSKGATKALELIGKHLGMFKDNKDVNVNIGVSIVDDIK